MITVDSWLLDLADLGPRYRGPAAQLARTQHDVSRNLGHILAFNDNFVRGRIKDAAKWGKLPRVNVRCIRCGAVASAFEWVRLATMGEPERVQAFERLPMRVRATSGMALRPCHGDMKAMQKLEVLEAQERGEI